MKTSTLTGADLNRAVAMSLGLKLVRKDAASVLAEGENPEWLVLTGKFHDQTRHFAISYPLPNYAGDIAAAWPIIEKHRMQFRSEQNIRYRAFIGLYGAEGTGETHIEAAMRCFVTSVYGDEIDLEAK